MAKLTYADIIERDQRAQALAELGLRVELIDTPRLMTRLVDLVAERWGRVDVLVNSAGHGPRSPVLDISDEDWHRGMEVYFLSAVRPTRLVTPMMQKQRSGVIINISTFATFEPDPAFPTSGVFRAGLAAFTKLFFFEVLDDFCFCFCGFQPVENR